MCIQKNLGSVTLIYKKIVVELQRIKDSHTLSTSKVLNI